MKSKRRRRVKNCQKGAFGNPRIWRTEEDKKKSRKYKKAQTEVVEKIGKRGFMKSFKRWLRIDKLEKRGRVK